MATRSEDSTILRIGKVIDVYDEEDGQRIQALVLPEDQYIPVMNIPWAFPLLPKMIHVVPKVGEAVLILTAKLDNARSQRYYLGPIIHQPQFMEKDSFEFGATTLLDGGNGLPSIPPSLIPDSNGALCKDNDIAIVGRKDTDIILGDDDLRIQCGVRLLNDENIIFNKENPTYIKLKYHDEQLIDKTKSSATIVSENINLISTSGLPKFETSDTNNLITDETLNKILEEAHVLPYGDILVKLLKIFIEAFKNHTHAYHGLKPVNDITYKTLDDFDLNDILSKHIRIN